MTTVNNFENKNRKDTVKIWLLRWKEKSEIVELLKGLITERARVKRNSKSNFFSDNKLSAKLIWKAGLCAPTLTDLSSSNFEKSVDVVNK